VKAIFLLEPGKLEVRDLPMPEPKEDEVLVRIRNCGICTLEQRLFTGDMKMNYPLVPGHEVSGEIVKISEDAITDLKEGMRVSLDMVNRCGHCYFCRTGKSNQCINRFNHKLPVLGGFSEYIVVKLKQVFKMPDSLSFEEAAFSEPLACCIHSLKRIGLTLAEDLLVIGAGTMGQLHIQAARVMGARVFVSDLSEKRLELAERSGAFRTINPAKEDVVSVVKGYTEGRGVDACVVTTPSHVALETGISALSNTGRLNIYTSYTDAPDLPINANKVHRSEKVITGSEGRTVYDFLQATRLLSYGMVDVKPLVSRKVSFDEIEEGMQAAMSMDTYRVLVEMNNHDTGL